MQAPVMHGGRDTGADADVQLADLPIGLRGIGPGWSVSFSKRNFDAPTILTL
jgi:hypothetical protein